MEEAKMGEPKTEGVKTEEPEIVINTSMTKEDYKKFLYIATFRKSKYTIPFLVAIAFIGSVIINFDNVGSNWIRLVISWILLLALAVVVVIFKVERKNKQRVKTDKTGAFDSVNTLKFYDDRIVMENKSLKSTGELNYDQFFGVMESKEYFIFYFTSNQASLIRKKDINNLEGFKEFVFGKFKNKYREIWHRRHYNSYVNLLNQNSYKDALGGTLAIFRLK